MRQYLTRSEAANYLSDRGFKTSKTTLQKWATTGGGPEYVRYGNKALYKPSNLDSFAAAKLRAPKGSTSEVHTATDTERDVGTA